MNAKDHSTDPSPLSDDELCQWLLQVARRADELSQARQRKSDRELWLRAEQETLPPEMAKARSDS